MTIADTSAPAAPEPTSAPAAFEAGSSLLTAAPVPAKDPVELPAGEEPAKEEAPKEEEKPEEPVLKAPEKYEFTLPDGMALNESLVAEFEPIAREADLTQEQASKLVEMHVRAEQARVNQWTETVKGWTEAAKSDPEFGGPKMAENMGTAVRALKEYGSPELNELLDSFGIGNHPAFIRFAYRAGKALGEDKLVPANSGGSKSAAELLYGNTDYGRNK
jgi:hypothetical protein